MLGRIIKGIGGFYYVKVEEDVIECKARGKFRHNELTPLVGDRVEISIKNNKGVIEKILPRGNELIRPNVANVTQAFVVFSIKSPDINLDLLNKFLVLCESKNLKILVCINKKDLANEEDKAFVERYFGNIGYEYFFIEAKNNQGVEKLQRHLANNVTVVCGPSGAGKSTLINKLCGKEVMATGLISEKNNRGKHTTRHSQLIDVEGGFIVDTPGFSSLDITMIKKEELQYCFPEFQDYIAECKFKGCFHHKEPNCAVKAAVDKGIINIDRYNSYLTMLEELIKIKTYNN
ncbi:MAG: ribosome small subunit-dependent GTPase A [Clostridiales bacterium]|uniref:ribosome small subunit-dependent GTPase A n=1 Tax=Clostridium sp. N3C TaxID=1776758 RepID=UPI00092DFD69|nr:ribosome small subunit-dependent GTPase A [Clostridium sp. N3C]NLZ49816.1 ribosome small subunit-dependent GTPase A [Clostridiales bacterium]SCN22014.1 putative ribosome biogenesis GTPase RsgA [Clostridium sp. N3C]